MKQGSGKRLNDKQRIEIIQLSENSKITKRQLADDYGVSEAAIRKLLLKKDEFLKRYYDAPEELRDQRLRGKSIGHRSMTGLSSYKNEYMNIDTNTDTGTMHANGTPSMLGFLTPTKFDNVDFTAVNTVAAAAAAAAAMGTAFGMIPMENSLYPQGEPWARGFDNLLEQILPFVHDFCRKKSFVLNDSDANTEHNKGLSSDINEVENSRTLMQKAVSADENVVLAPTSPTSSTTDEMSVTMNIGDAGDMMGANVQMSEAEEGSAHPDMYPGTASLGARTVDWMGFARMLRDIRFAFHCYPEVGYQEVKTQSFIQRFCENALNIPSKNVQIMASTGLVIDVCYDNTELQLNGKHKIPILAFRSDMDALPILERNEHLPYCSTHKMTLESDQYRKRKKRKSGHSVDGDLTEDVGLNTSPFEDSANKLATADSALHRQASATKASDAAIKQSSVIKMEPPDLDAFQATDSIENKTCIKDEDLVSVDDAVCMTSPTAHMCGHDGHMTILLGLMTLIVRQSHLLPRDSFIRFIFQPAEEGPGGAQRMIEEGALANVDEIYGLHNYPFPLYSVHARPGPVMAHEIEFTMDIEGVGGHGSAPQDCVDPIYVGSSIVQALQSVVSRSLSPIDSVVLSVTQFRAGETNNVIPSTATLGGTIRSFDLKIAEAIKKRMESIVQSLCRAFGASCRIQFTDGYPPVINPFQETRIVQQIAHEVGLYVSQEGLPLLASEDFAYYLQERKGCFFFLGTKEQHDDTNKRALHSNRFDFNDKAAPLGIRMFLGIIQARFRCFLYSLDEMQTLQVAMERILSEPNYAIC